MHPSLRIGLALCLASSALLHAAPRDLLDGATFKGAESGPAGVSFRFDLGTKRQNWTHARWSVAEFAEPVDLSGTHAIALSVASAQARADAGVYLAIREADGSWYSHPWASDLSAAANQGLARYEDFSQPAYHSPPGGDFKDEDGKLDVRAISAIAIGVVNPLGVGEVAFTLSSLKAVEAPLPPPGPLAVHVTGKLIDINGTTQLPAGVFGGFNLKAMNVPGAESTGVDKKGNPVFPTIPRVTRYRLAMDKKSEYNVYADTPAFGSETTPILIHSVGDRTQPNPRVNDAGWKDKFAKGGAALGEKAKADPRTAYVEFWNEPYLNWANDNRKMFDPKFYDESRAVEGGPVHIRHDGEVMPHLKWTKDFNAPLWNWTRMGLQEWRRGRSEDGKPSIGDYARMYQTQIPAWRKLVTERNPPDDVKDGETYLVGDKTFTAYTPWHIYDETQFTYWSGRGMLKPYIESLLAYGTPMKAAAGDKVQLIAGWGNRPSEDHWAAWDILYKPTLDAAIGILDAYNDHDYGSDPRTMSANYEVVTGYGVAEHGKWLYAYNTETASNADPQNRSGEVELSGDGNKFTWVSRKIASILAYSADKCRGLAHFGVGGGFWSDEGEGVAMDLMRNLRGRLVHVESADPEVYVISAIDGTDPLAPRPDDLPKRQELVTLVLNDRSETRNVTLHFVPTVGTRFTDGKVKWGKANPATGKVEIGESELAVTEGAATWTADLPPYQPVVITLGLAGEVAADAPATVRQRQAFAKPILQDLSPAAPLQTTIHVADASKVSRAWVRFVAERLGHGEAELVLNGHVLPLPAVVSPENNPLTRQFAIDPAFVKAENTVEVRIKDSKHAGFLLGNLSLIVESAD